MDWTYATILTVLAFIVLFAGAQLGDTNAAWPLGAFVVTYGMTYGLVRLLAAKL